MAKRRADKELNHDNWQLEEDAAEDGGGVFKRASEEELSKRVIKTARRRGADTITTGDNEGPSVFKNFTGFGNMGSSTSGGGSSSSSKLASFDFYTGKSLSQFSSKNMFESSSFKLGASATSSDATTFSFGSSSNKENSKPTEEKSKPPSNGIGDESGDESSSGASINEGNNTAYLAHLKVLNEGVLQWIQKHLAANININLNPVFDDYRTHFDDLQGRYKPKFSSKTGSSSSSSTKVDSQEFAKKNGSTLPDKQAQISSGSSDFNFKSGSKPDFQFSSSSEKKSSAFSFCSSDSKPNESSNSAGAGFTVSKPKESTGFSSSDSKSAGTPAELFSLGSSVTKPKESTGFSFGSTDKPKENSSSSSGVGGGSSFSFGSGESSKPKESAGFSFGGSTAPIMFGAKEGSGAFSFVSKASTSSAFTFAPTTSFTSSTTSASTTNTDAEEDTPPKVEVVEVKEDDALYEKKCKLFYKKDGVFIDKGVGTLFLKPAGDECKKTQLLVRAATNLGNVLLNIVLNSSLPTMRTGKNNVLIVCVPNPPIDPKVESNTPVTMLIRVKTSDDADELLKKIDEHKGE
uniref:Nuclear pore complex protein Nup50-like n=1 Tax=Hirondellea gigas TaxID=1518452 RepID=A0A2P2HY03_9CRUS